MIYSNTENLQYTSSSVGVTAWADWVPMCSSSSSAHASVEMSPPKYEVTSSTD